MPPRKKRFAKGDFVGWVELDAYGCNEHFYVDYGIIMDTKFNFGSKSGGFAYVHWLNGERSWIEFRSLSVLSRAPSP